MPENPEAEVTSTGTETELEVSTDSSSGEEVGVESAPSSTTEAVDPAIEPEEVV